MAQASIISRTPEAAQRRRSSQRTVASFLGGLLFFLLVAGYGAKGLWSAIDWLQDSQRLPLSRLVITGQREFTTDDDIRRAILSMGPLGSFMTQDARSIQQQLMLMPWISQVSVRKEWPDVLRINLAEYVPVARWNDMQLVDNQGKSFSAPLDRMASRQLPLLYGPEGSEKEVLDAWHSMEKLMQENGFHLTMLALSPRHSWQAGLDGDIRLELGRGNRMERLKRFIELYPLLQQQTDKRISYVDLRYDTGLAVGWAPLLVPAPVQGGKANPVTTNQANTKSG
ncbi:cell division protein FtsQ/DivIB [Plesiomonas shigelloides]|uniref:Cell division protein FtsQ n=1 Tax=Plesiomonas shigelloides TaxID=703 RepID=A0A8I1W527_PLESH|nr:cell division protein FtsQ/DivIB [Plesiomonas shigelloides]MBO1108029.1 cell division protein FtsQ/DivIB [Plesiomonas shigelloides]